MKKVLIIGSTVVDVIIQVDHLPKTQEDVHVLSQKMSLGGCAYNTSDMIRHFQVPCLLFSPVGSGAYGDFVRRELSARGITTPIPSPARENGCCYCFVEAGGERTFASYHGAEYRFEKEWFQIPEAREIDTVYICGLEIEEPTGENIVAYLEAHPDFRVYFAPGPRIMRIRRELLERIFALHPVLHLNEDELLSFYEIRCRTGHPSNGKNALTDVPSDLEGAQTGDRLAQAAGALFELTHNTVIVTLGERGAFYFTGSGSGYVPGVPARQRDTIGAGDSHAGAVIACEKLGLPLPEALRIANRAAAKVVETEGALLSDEAFSALGFQFSV